MAAVESLSFEYRPAQERIAILRGYFDGGSWRCLRDVRSRVHEIALDYSNMARSRC